MRSIAIACVVGAAVLVSVTAAPQKRAAFWKGQGGKAMREKLGVGPRKKSTKSLAASRRLQGFGGDWPQEHFDVRNSGSTTYLGPGDTPGFCRASILKTEPTDPTSVSYSSTGVTTQSDSSAWFGGGSDNVLNIGQIYGLNTVTLTPLNLATYSTRSPVTPYGIVASAVDYINDIGDSVVQPSADGTAYQFWWMSCLAQSQARALMPEHFAMDPAEAERSALEEVPPSPAAPGVSFHASLAAKVYRVNPDTARKAMFVSAEAADNVTSWARSPDNTAWGRALEKAARVGIRSALSEAAPFPSCLQWQAQLASPLYSPARYLSYGVGTSGPLVMVSETNPSLDTGGVLHAFDADTGAEVWNFPAVDASGKSWGLKGIAPAIDEVGLENGAIFLAFGNRVVALNPADGTIWATLDAPPSSDNFVSSPTLSIMADQMFVHSTSGTLWRASINSPDGVAITMSWAWACDYTVVGSGPNSTLSDCQAQPTAESPMFTKKLPSPRYDASGLNIVGWDSITRGDYVNGGFYQATTRTQRAELYDAILAAHVASGSGKPEWGSSEGRASALMTLGVGEMADLASALPRETLHSLTTPSGYRALGPNGKPVTAKQLASNALPGTVPLATPAIDESLFSLDDSLIVPQFLPYGRGDEGLFVVTSDSGNVMWGFNSWKTTDGDTVYFGRSRSSPVIDGDDFAYVGECAWLRRALPLRCGSRHAHPPDLRRRRTPSPSHPFPPAAADIDDPLEPGSTIPVLFALDAVLGEMVWASNLGFEANTTFGASSPAVIDGYGEYFFRAADRRSGH